MFKALKRAYGAGYRTGRGAYLPFPYRRKVGERDGQSLYLEVAAPRNPFREARGPVGWLLRNVWEAARFDGLRDRVMNNRRA